MRFDLSLMGVGLTGLGCASSYLAYLQYLDVQNWVPDQAIGCIAGPSLVLLGIGIFIASFSD